MPEPQGQAPRLAFVVEYGHLYTILDLSPAARVAGAAPIPCAWLARSALPGCPDLSAIVRPGKNFAAVPRIRSCPRHFQNHSSPLRSCLIDGSRERPAP